MSCRRAGTGATLARRCCQRPTKELTGFGFPFDRFLPSHAFGALSLVLVLLPLAGVASYAFELRGAWRKTYLASALIALYLNVFVLVVQLFAKVPVLHDAAPTQTELPFALAQASVLLLFVAIGWATLRRLQPSAAALA